MDEHNCRTLLSDVTTVKLLIPVNYDMQGDQDCSIFENSTQKPREKSENSKNSTKLYQNLPKRHSKYSYDIY